MFSGVLNGVNNGNDNAIRTTLMSQHTFCSSSQSDLQTRTQTIDYNIISKGLKVQIILFFMISNQQYPRVLG